MDKKDGCDNWSICTDGCDNWSINYELKFTQIKFRRVGLKRGSYLDSFFTLGPSGLLSFGTQWYACIHKDGCDYWSICTDVSYLITCMSYCFLENCAT